MFGLCRGGGGPGCPFALIYSADILYPGGRPDRPGPGRPVYQPGAGVFCSSGGINPEREFSVVSRYGAGSGTGRYRGGRIGQGQGLTEFAGVARRSRAGGVKSENSVVRTDIDPQGVC